jgi:hypothetical protein
MFWMKTNWRRDYALHSSFRQLNHMAVILKNNPNLSSGFMLGIFLEMVISMCILANAWEPSLEGGN